MDKLQIYAAQLGLSTMAAAIASKCGLLGWMLVAVAAAMVIDFLAGMAASAKEAVEHPDDDKYGWSSRKGMIGIFKKFGYILVIVASMIFFPFLTILSILIGVIGGWLIAAATGIMIPADYVDGLLMDFRPYSITYTLIKTVFFAYIITSISAFYGYYARGNSLEVGAASTRAVVASSIVILLFDLILTQVLLI